MKKTCVLGLLMATSTMMWAKTDEAIARIDAAGKVFTEVMNAPDKGVPHELYDKANCIAIIPGMKKAGFVIGGNYGKGVMTCRNSSMASGWTGPSTVRVEGGSFGAQIGAGETDLVLLVMNQEGADKLMGDKFTFGGDASAMAGPVGRDASATTDAKLTAGILSYSRARGAFAGVTLNGSTLRPDNDDNRTIYGHEVSHKDILTGKVPAPPAARSLYASLNSPANMDSSGSTRARTTK
jgi:lipid-binding SYLF domain-containing protein